MTEHKYKRRSLKSDRLNEERINMHLDQFLFTSVSQNAAATHSHSFHSAQKCLFHIILHIFFLYRSDIGKLWIQGQPWYENQQPLVYFSRQGNKQKSHMEHKVRKVRRVVKFQCSPPRDSLCFTRHHRFPGYFLVLPQYSYGLSKFGESDQPYSRPGKSVINTKIKFQLLLPNWQFPD